MANWSDKKVRQPMKQLGAKLHDYKLFYIPAWISVADQLMEAAEIVIKSQKEKYDAFWTTLRNGQDPEYFNLVPAGLLYGLSLEALLKAILIKQGKIRSHEQARKYSHRLDELAKESGLKLDEKEMRMIFLLKDKIIWRAKYPTPLSSDDFYLKDNRNEVIMTENYDAYFKFHELYAKILNFLRNEKYYSNDLMELHSLSEERPALYQALYDDMEKKQNTDQINFQIQENDQKIDEMISKLTVAR